MSENQTAAAVSTRQLVKSFENGELATPVLKGIDLDCRAGEILMIVGPSGCGKTTLLSCVAGTLDIDSGRIFVFGEEISAMKEKTLLDFRAQNLGFIFQSFNLIPTLTLAENVAVPMFLNGYDEEEARASSMEILEKVGLGKRGDDKVTHLSGGQQQRVAIARALVHQPRLVICDEPTSALDGKTGAGVVALLKDVAKSEGRSVILVTHDHRIFHFADRIVEMEDGQVLAIHDDPKNFIGKLV
ncbi:MAG: ABC transporter ATP-binding protein [bacterium]